jgi:hypothetical protein
MDTYTNNYKTYNVESVSYDGTIINVNGTSITDLELMGKNMPKPHKMDGYSVELDGEEYLFDTFDKAYQFAIK